MAEEVKNTASSKLTNFIEKNKKVVFAIFAIIIVALVAYVVVDACSSKAAEKGLSAVDEISYNFTNESTGLSDEDIEARQTKALEDLAPYCKKSGITGVRANMLAGEIAYQQKNYEDALNYWKACAQKGKNAYTAPIAYFNIGSCYEYLNDTDNAIEYYKKACDVKDYILHTHAMFSYARALDSKGDYKAAYEAYSKLNDENPDDDWAKLAKTRMIQLQIEGKTE